MKKSNLFLLILLLFGTLFVACSDEGNGGGDDGDYPSYVADGSAYEQWTYFDFETGEGRTLKIKGEEGAVTGVYYGSLKALVGTTPAGSQDSVNFIITRISEDTVSVQLNGLTISSGSSTEPYDLIGNAIAQKMNGKWILTAIESKCDVGSGANLKVWTVKLGGEIGVKKGEVAKLSGTIQPDGMPMPISITCEGFVDYSMLYVVDGDETSFDWDIAFHKYDIRTNGGAAVKTSSASLTGLTIIPVDGFVEDVDGDVIADMSQMMKGYVGYQNCKLNKVLCGWVTAIPTGTMPPYTYELNSNVFVVKTKAGKYAKIKFTDTTNEKNKAVYAAFSYEYPMK